MDVRKKSLARIRILRENSLRIRSIGRVKVLLLPDVTESPVERSDWSRKRSQRKNAAGVGGGGMEEKRRERSSLVEEPSLGAGGSVWGLWDCDLPAHTSPAYSS